MKTSYKKIVEHYEQCLKTHGDSHLGVDWPNLKDALTRYQVMLDVVTDKSQNVTLLDFGCGTSHLYQYILDHNIENFSYSGLDISKSYIDVSQKKYPKNTYFNQDILKDSENLPSFDYIICNGVFTEKRELSFDDMWYYFTDMVTIIFSKATIGVAFNVMSKAVDWERSDLFHLSTDTLIEFMTKTLSRNFVIRNDYGLYEYTVYLYK